MKSPITEDKVAICIALTPNPFCDSGKPSKSVGADPGPPGIFKEIAEMQPPKTPDFPIT